MLNKQKGNMYGFVTHTWNPIKGICPHDCKYCYMKVWKQKPLRLDEKDLYDNLGKPGKGNFIFVGSSTDMFADDVPYEWIKKVLKVCRGYPKNKYLFQTKNPHRFGVFKSQFPKNTLFATTLETNRRGFRYNAPSVINRQFYIGYYAFKTMVTIEPIMDFDLDIFVEWIKDVHPEFVSIGADSKGHNLPEPSAEKVKLLIEQLSKFTKVIQKDNLKRLFK